MYDLAEFDKLVEEGYVRKVETKDLVLYNYTDKCVYDRKWDTKYTRDARGIIFEKETGKLIAKPFPKFFNLGEMPETFLTALPDVTYTVSEKLDGSLGILYHYRGEWHVATRGSFSSEQAVKAREILYTQYKVGTLAPGITYLVEIIYPGNKIVVDYGKSERLILLGGYDTHSGLEVSFNLPLGMHISGMSRAKDYSYTIDQMIELQKTMPKDQEGFVVRFQGGLRVKIKGQEYLRIHKIISNLSPISFWEAMKDGVVNRDYLAQVPEEFEKDFKPIVIELERQYEKVLFEITNDALLIPSPKQNVWTEGHDKKPWFRDVGIFLKENPDIVAHPSAVFPYITENYQAIDKYIMRHIRPTGNVLK